MKWNPIETAPRANATRRPRCGTRGPVPRSSPTGSLLAKTVASAAPSLMSANGVRFPRARLKIRSGCWCIGVTPIDEDIPLPSWPMRWSATGYTTVLEIDAPDDADLTQQP